MAGYTSDEKQTVIDRFLLGRISTPRTTLGARDVLAARDDIYSLLTTTLLLKPDSYFYVIWLAKNRLEALRRKQIEALTYILQDSTKAALVRRGRPVRTTADLSNAQAALLNLNTSLNSGVVGSGPRELGPEVSRFRRSIERFIRKELFNNVVESNEVTETADEVRARIRTLWADVQTRHAQMLTLCDAIENAISNLAAVRLPEKAVQGVVTRMRSRLDELTVQLEADKTLTTHRESMLELLVMRTLLTRVSSFRVPQEILAPLVGDAPLLEGTGGTSPASLMGSVSGPFNIESGDDISFETGSPVVTSTIAFGTTSNAAVTTRSSWTFPVLFPVGSEFRLRVDGTLYPNSTFLSGSSYVSLAALLSDIQSYIAMNAVPVAASIVSGAIRIQSDSAADVSSIEVITSTDGQKTAAALLGITPYAVCQPITTRQIVELGGSYPGVLLSEVRTEYGVFRGVTRPSAVLDLSKVDGTDLSGSGTLFSASGTNFTSLGVVAGDYLYVVPQLASSPITSAPAEYHRISSVSGGTLRLETALDATKIAVDGLSSYRIGADFTGVPSGARVLLTSAEQPLNGGPYRVVSGSIGQLTLDRTFFATLDTVNANIFTSYLVAAAPGSTPADGIAVWPASTGATIVGLPTSPTQSRAQFTSLAATSNVDFLSRGVQAGDVLVLPDGDETEITSVSLGSISVTGITYFAGTTAYTIKSGRYDAWLSLVENVRTFTEDVDFKSAEFAITRLVSGAAPTTSVLQALDAFNERLEDLADIEEYVVPFERTVDNVLRTLTEQGMDRAADLLTTLRVSEFFSMHPDGVSYSTNLIRTAADVTRQVAPVSRFAKSLLGSPEVRLRSRRFLG
jgi:hypothetical protein